MEMGSGSEISSQVKGGGAVDVVHRAQNKSLELKPVLEQLLQNDHLLESL